MFCKTGNEIFFTKIWKQNYQNHVNDFNYKFKLNFKLSVKENAYFLFSEKKQEICNTENSVEESVSAKPTQIKAKDTNNFCIKRNVNLRLRNKIPQETYSALNHANNLQIIIVLLDAKISTTTSVPS